MQRLVARTALAALFLLTGFALPLLLAYAVREVTGTIPADRSREVQAGLVAAFVVIEVKALLPQLLGASLLLAVSRPWLGTPGFLVTALWVIGCAAAAYAVVGPLLLTADHAALPGLHPRNTLDHVMTFLLCTAGVSASLLLARWFLPGEAEAS